MELVDGVPVDTYCRTNNLPIEDCCQLFLKICEGVTYAHQNLVIHRDLKPGNIRRMQPGCRSYWISAWPNY